MKSETQKTPALRFRAFDGDWTEAKIGDVTSHVDYRGKTPPKSESGVFLVTAKNVKVGHIDYECSKEYIPKELYDEVMRRGRPRLGDVLITTEAPLGNVATIDRIDVALAQRIIKFRGKESVLSNDFLKHLLLSQSFQKLLNEKSTGSTAKGIKGSVLHKLPLVFPVMAEQQKIAAFLSAVDEKVSQLARKKDFLFKYKKGLLQQIFDREIRFKDDNRNDFPDWGESPLGTLCKIYDGTHMTPDYKESGVPFYSVEHVTSNNFSETKYIAEEVYESEKKRVVLEKGDILMTRIGDIGTSKYISWDVKASFYVSLALIKKSSKISSPYLDQFIKSHIFQRELHRRTLHVAFPKKINLGEISECRVLTPVIEEQIKIAKLLSAVDQRIELVTKQAERLRTFKKGLLQQMFV
ncbi:MAG TPA: hypothetical protein DC054_11980 [Blastocatellia bacterium]|nr:hypothetical protein [Blastocatellia bacterium]